jgi:elongation factor P--(R)-beta-lysine ligase
MSLDPIPNEFQEKISTLQSRALMLEKVRSFFAKRNVFEVDPPLLSPYPALDLHIEPMEVAMDTAEDFSQGKKGYLHTSPEYMMKKLLSEGMKDIYFLGHVFRKEEIGAFHFPEFTMIEWYRYGLSYEKFLEEILDLFQLFLGKRLKEKMSYKQAFLRFLSLDPYRASKEDLLHKALKEKIPLPEIALDKDLLLQILMSDLIEPKFDKEKIIILDEFPASQAALAEITTDQEGDLVGQRFEFYSGGIELGNGYHELQDAREQEKRFLETNENRKAIGKKALPIDQDLLKALKRGIGNCFGVAVGFDRLFMLKEKKKNIHDVMILP